MPSIDELEQSFLAAPDGPGLMQLYERLLEELEDARLASILDKIRPIQHRVTLVQADVEPFLLEALARDPHVAVRTVVATHALISEEVCFRLAEDQDDGVRLALRKNPACHPLIRASLFLSEHKAARMLTQAELLLEVAWEARRAEFDAERAVEIVEEWTGVDAEHLHKLSSEDGQLVLSVFTAHLGRGPMPRKPRKRKKKTKKKR